MSIRVRLENPPEFYTNLDFIQGHVVLSLSRPEQIGAIIVKLEGESRTALGVPTDSPGMGIAGRERSTSGDTLHENHKILYKVGQVFPDETGPAPMQQPHMLNPGQHSFPFSFKFPFNNACGNVEAMSRIGGVVNAGGFFGAGFRVMDGTKQLMYSHVTKTLPPSFTGFPGEAEIRYYVKVTVQRPGIFKENWRHQMGLKFLPIEPPRPVKTNQEAYARRPFTFQPKSPTPAPYPKKRSSFFGRSSSGPSTPVMAADGFSSNGGAASSNPPSVEMSARLPHPAILTCNKPVPLRLIAKKLLPSSGDVYLTTIQIDLVGKTTVRCQNLVNNEMSRWVVLSRHGLSIPVAKPEDAVGTEIAVPDYLWTDAPLPNTVMPSFLTCNLSRDYQLEIKLGLAWGKPSGLPSTFLGRPKNSPHLASHIPQELHLPLHFSSIQVYSGLAPPPALVEALRQGRGRRNSRPPKTGSGPSTSQRPPRTSTQTAPTLPPRPSPQTQVQQPPEALYPPQLAPGEIPPYDDAPPTYEEAMAEEMTGPAIPNGGARPAWSGVTDENQPSSLGGGAEKG
ncbi:uncharacterized protein C8A04DRAFT_14807 [Dichotomopilus funicola]|uniref:Arrestin-like N-terminal domain-containing protein n=1 Tax=Dichotomopilus funicola TaxID=1934379 RepID=A0AAN6UY28_9PEZI|nr:hypothetical protein C8A04DRAFT_14807 [Dichotomopilus funicola]